MNKKIHIGELHILARSMPYKEFASYLAKRLGDIPECVESHEYTDELFLYGNDVLKCKIT